MTEPTQDPGLFDIEDTESKARAIAAARALPRDSDIPHSDVKRWLDSWGTPNELPPPSK